ncbi:MAG: hypothetical protein K8S62_11300 [Candidatus Sabulitectum sp.]|nr:hypothetical protein [Candidatus Sabulitectum sp.]
MTAEYLVFATLLTVPLSAMICTSNFLYFFILFPAAAVFSGRWKYCGRLFFLSFPPVVLLVWACLAGNDQSALRSLRWICALASGTYFASELGTAGTAGVLRSMRMFPSAGKLSELMLLAGSTASNVRRCWMENAELPLFPRIIQSAGDSVSGASLNLPEQQPPGVFPLSIAVVSWLFVLVSVSGIADGVVE